MRAMIIHPDMQPLVIRDFDNEIISFGIIYVNREEGYAVINDFEVNRKYADSKQREALIAKAEEQGEITPALKQELNISFEKYKKLASEIASLKEKTKNIN